MLGTLPIMDTGTNSLARSTDTAGCRLTLMVFAIVPTKRVYPSGEAVATERAAILLLAPARLSTINCWPKVCPSLCASTRAATSVALPAGNPTIIFTGLDGKTSLARTEDGKASVATTSSPRRDRFFRCIFWALQCLVFFNKVYLTPLASIDLQGQKRHYVN